MPSYSHVRARQPEVGTAPLIEPIDGIDYRWLPAPTSGWRARTCEYDAATICTRCPARTHSRAR